MASKCSRCGARFADEADTPHEVLCWSCGARRRHPRAVGRPQAFTLEAMHHYATRRELILRHRLVTEAMALAIVLAAAGGAYFLLGG